MSSRSVGVIMNGVTGRMGYRQHLVRSILAIGEQGGVALCDGGTLLVEPILVGRDKAKLRAIASRHGVQRWTTSLEEALAQPAADIYFDAQVTGERASAIRRAIEAGKHVYTEKPTASSLQDALELARLARERGVRSGVVADKLFLPGLVKLKRLVDGGFFGRILSVRGEFGYWVFEGDWQRSQRPSWNYRDEQAGGIVLDMFPHWHYVLEQIVAPVTSVYAHASTHIHERTDERGECYDVLTDDAAYAIFELQGGVVAQVNSSWTVRVDRSELVEFQVDGTHGSAVAGLRNCRVQHRTATPMFTWDPDVPMAEDPRAQWTEMPDNDEFDNGFKVQWEAFLRHAVAGSPWSFDLLAGARGVQLAELALRSAREGRRIAVPSLEA